MDETTELLRNGVTIPHREGENKKNSNHTLRNACIALLVVFSVFHLSGGGIREGALENAKKFSSNEAAGPSSTVTAIYNYFINIYGECKNSECGGDHHHHDPHHHHHHSHDDDESEEDETGESTSAPSHVSSEGESVNERGRTGRNNGNGNGNRGNGNNGNGNGNNGNGNGNGNGNNGNGNNGNGNGNGNGGVGNGNGNGNNNTGGGTGTGASTGGSSTAQMPLNMNFIRSFDGSEDRRAGNNAELLRLSGPANYPDGAGVGLSMITEPSARGISNTVADPTTLSTPPGRSTASDMLWQWGQFMDHDIGLTEGHDEEFTIVSPSCTDGDIVCHIPFRRAIHVFTNGVREQINEITGFLDASNVYGHTKERADALREFTGGRLLMTPDGLLPPNTQGLPNALPPCFDGSDLFLAGDVRVNEQTGLIAIHTLFVREHNRVAGLLGDSFPSSSDEELFQMARKIVIAELQAITYKEFLPTLIGSFAPDISAYRGFDASVNPGIAQEFSTVAFRVGHTLLSSNLLLHDGTQRTGSISLLTSFFDPTLVHDDPKIVDELLFGLTIQAANKADTKVIPDVRDFLFGHPVGGVGLDLVSLNIQRGRDCGVQKYNSMRSGMGLARKATFSDITSNREIAAELAAAYPSPNECDPWICGIAEDPAGGGELGELFSTIIANQFQRLMDGDEFFYLNDRDVRNRLITSIIDVNSITLTDVINANTFGGLSGSAMRAGL